MSVLENFFDYFLSKSEHLREETYKNYHETVRRIVLDEKNPKANVMLAIQLAAIYELRFYKKYYDVTLRIMEMQNDAWKSSEWISYYKKEFEETKSFILKKQNVCNQKLEFFLSILKYSTFAFLIYFIILVINKLALMGVNYLFK
ncbi:hypothetical protein GYA49_00370 [Candidatus Beckwithbacteria bacterium]|nr:hypothetical protein [Candidatus Beckwithbacteria bacterium]